MASPNSDKGTPPGPSSSAPRLQAGPLEPWTIREKLCLASAVRHNGDQNWMTVSKSMRPFLEAHRPSERFAPKNAAMQYASLLEGKSRLFYGNRNQGLGLDVSLHPLPSLCTTSLPLPHFIAVHPISPAPLISSPNDSFTPPSLDHCLPLYFQRR